MEWIDLIVIAALTLLVLGLGISMLRRKRAEEALAQQLAFLQILMDAIPNPVFYRDTLGVYRGCNKAFEAFMGESREEIIGKTVYDIAPEELARRYEEKDTQLFRSPGHQIHETVVQRSDGKRRDVIFNKATFEDAEGRLAGLVGVIEDITRRKRALEKLRHYADELERSNRELEQFAYVASHDLQEPLRKVQAFCDRLASRYASVLDSRGQDYLSRMQSAAARMQSMIEDLLTLSRVTTRGRPFQPTDLRQVLKEALSDLEMRVKRTQARVLAGKLAVVDADPVQIRQLLGNLVGNALKFQKQGALPEIKVYGKVDRESPPSAADGGSPSPFYHLHVEDNGIGFDEKYLEKIFQPFQRLHGRGEYEGSGIGLATCRKIAERHGGRITARSIPGKGSDFVVSLPLRQPAEAKEEATGIRQETSWTRNGLL